MSSDSWVYLCWTAYGYWIFHMSVFFWTSVYLHFHLLKFFSLEHTFSYLPPMVPITGHLWAALLTRASLVAQRLKHLLAMRETWVRSLGLEDPLEKEMATHSSTFAWKIPWMEEPGGLQSMGRRVRHNWVTSLYFTPGCKHFPGRWRLNSMPLSRC